MKDYGTWLMFIYLLFAIGVLVLLITGAAIAMRLMKGA